MCVFRNTNNIISENFEYGLLKNVQPLVFGKATRVNKPLLAGILTGLNKHNAKITITQQKQHNITVALDNKLSFLAKHRLNIFDRLSNLKEASHKLLMS